MRDQLQTLGYRVTAHVSPLEALADFLARPLDFDVILTDLTMPGMSGADLAERILKVRPDLPIVMATGYGHVMSEERAREIGLRPLLLQAVLDGRARRRDPGRAGLRPHRIVGAAGREFAWQKPE